jgi:hypothetical protein
MDGKFRKDIETLKKSGNIGNEKLNKSNTKTVKSIIGRLDQAEEKNISIEDKLRKY